jgi:hypothetical protein
VAFLRKLANTTILKESRCSPPTIPGDERPDSRRNEGATGAAVHVRPTRRQIIVADAFKANWADTMDHAIGYHAHAGTVPLLRIQFQSPLA